MVAVLPILPLDKSSYLWVYQAGFSLCCKQLLFPFPVLFCQFCFLCFTSAVTGGGGGGGGGAYNRMYFLVYR